MADLAAAHGRAEVIKVKSISTDEIELNAALEARGIHAVETDLAELIVQLADDAPSHILVPAIHKNRAEIRELFRRKLGAELLTDDPAALAEAARLYLREKFLTHEGGGVGRQLRGCRDRHGLRGGVRGQRADVPDPARGADLCDGHREGAAAVGGHRAVHAGSCRSSSTAERMNPYTSFWSGVREGDGPQAFHLVLLDNGRTDVLADEVGPLDAALHPLLGLPQRLPGI